MVSVGELSLRCSCAASVSSCKAPLPTVLRREMFMGQRPFMGMSQAQVSTTHSCA